LYAKDTKYLETNTLPKQQPALQGGVVDIYEEKPLAVRAAGFYIRKL
jgi:hypothetical protein